MPTGLFDDPRLLAPPATRKTDLGGGAFLLQSPETLAPYARCVGEWLERWARETPDAMAVAESVPGGGWRRLDWRGLRRQVGAVAQSLLDLELAAGSRQADHAERLKAITVPEDIKAMCG